MPLGKLDTQSPTPALFLYLYTLLHGLQVTLEDVEALAEDTEEAREYEERVRELLAESMNAEADAAALQELSRLEAAEEPEKAAEDATAAAKVGFAQDFSSAQPFFEHWEIYLVIHVVVSCRPAPQPIAEAGKHCDPWPLLCCLYSSQIMCHAQRLHCQAYQ